MSRKRLPEGFSIKNDLTTKRIRGMIYVYPPPEWQSSAALRGQVNIRRKKYEHLQSKSG
jgi:hypothetical protein